MNSEHDTEVDVSEGFQNHDKESNKRHAFKVLTYNIFAGKFSMDPKRISAQIDAVKALDCDIMCFQEAWDRNTIEKYRVAFQGYDLITCNSNLDSEQNSTLLLSRGGFCQRICEYILPFVFMSIFLFILLYYYIGLNFELGTYLIPVFVISLMFSITLAVFSTTFIRFVWRALKLPQHGFITGDILGLMIIVRRSENQSGLKIRFVENSAFAEVFSRQAAKGVWKLFGCVERFFIVKGYLSIDICLNNRVIAVTNIHLNTGTTNEARMVQIRELFRKAVPSSRPVILCGDTNADPSQPEIRWISSELIDTYKKCRNPNVRRTSRCDGYTWHSANDLTHQGFLFDPNMRIDYIWFRNALNQTSFSRIDQEELDSDPNLGQESASENEADTRTTHEIRILDSRVVLDQHPFHSDHFGVCTDFEINEEKFYRTLSFLPTSHYDSSN